MATETIEASVLNEVRGDVKRILSGDCPTGLWHTDKLKEIEDRLKPCEDASKTVQRWDSKLDRIIVGIIAAVAIFLATSYISTTRANEAKLAASNAESTITQELRSMREEMRFGSPPYTRGGADHPPREGAQPVKP